MLTRLRSFTLHELYRFSSRNIYLVTAMLLKYCRIWFQYYCIQCRGRTQMYEVTDPCAPGPIVVDPDTDNPDMVWADMSKDIVVTEVTPMDLKTPIKANKVRFVCISDTHNQTEHLAQHIPPGDVLLHAGDSTMCGSPHEITEFEKFIESLPHKKKIIIAGNHDYLFEPTLADQEFGSGSVKQFLASKGVDRLSQIFTTCEYLEDSEITVYGLRIYGSPWQPWFRGGAFNVDRGEECLEKWNLIPENVDVLMTHSPPLGFGDFSRHDTRSGCVELLNTVRRRVKPRYHVYGHIHEGYGIRSDGHTTFINASTCNVDYQPINKPIIFDIPLPPGVSKDK